MKTNTKNLEELTIPKGTVIHLRGIPFELPEDTKVLGLQSNLDLANQESLKGCTGVAIGGDRKLTRIEVVTRALRDAGYVIVDYKSNHNENTDLTGLVIARLKD